jgi:molybdate transport system substrate-binding protein
LLIVAFVAITCLPVFAQRKSEITVAAAADLNYALRDLAAAYEKQTGTSVKLVFGSSGNLTTQIENGAPYDVFLSADIEYPRQLIAHQVADPDSLYVYGMGRLVVWVPRSRPLHFADGLHALTSLAVERIAIANPAHAPYGRAAVAALKNAGVYDAVKNKLVLGENVSQAAQFVQSGNAQAGLIAFSLAVSPPMKSFGEFWELPVNMYPALDQGLVILNRSTHKREARAFVEYLKRPESRAVFSQYGFSQPAQAGKP